MLRGGTAGGSSWTGRPGTGASGRSWTDRPLPTCLARVFRSSVFTCLCTRTGPARWKAITTATTGPTAPFPIRIAGRSSPPRDRSPLISRPGAGPRPCSKGSSTTRINFKARGWSRGSSPWLLDEPANFQDYWALRYFARAFHEGINQALNSRAADLVRLTADGWFSAPTFPGRSGGATASTACWIITWSGSAMRSYPRLVFERKRALGEIVLEYGSTNPVEGSNLQPVAWCLDTWSLGADGVIPWQTVGSADSWERADELSLFYPARTRGQRGSNRSDAGGGLPPIPSIRLKAYRRGQQDVEYLMLWSTWRNEPRWAVGEQARATLNLAGARQGTGIAGDRGRRPDRLRPPPPQGPLDLTAQPSARQYLRPIPPSRASLSIFAHLDETENHLPPAYVGARSRGFILVKECPTQNARLSRER